MMKSFRSYDKPSFYGYNSHVLKENSLDVSNQMTCSTAVSQKDRESSFFIDTSTSIQNSISYDLRRPIDSYEECIYKSKADDYHILFKSCNPDSTID